MRLKQYRIFQQNYFHFSDDMDGLRKVPDNIPNKELIAKHLGKPLTKVPDPFEKFNSFGEHNNAMLKSFLDSFGFQYEFQSSTHYYTNGLFDEKLQAVLENYDGYYGNYVTVTWCRTTIYIQPVFCLYVYVQVWFCKCLWLSAIHQKVQLYIWIQKLREKIEVSIFGGACKLQWKVDWAMRWAALDVDYEMSGKDLIDSVKLASKIVRVLGGQPPEGFNYELFLDGEGQKYLNQKATVLQWKIG
jgi:lysyl-tRNA synthetase class 1